LADLQSSVKTWKFSWQQGMNSESFNMSEDYGDIHNSWDSEQGKFVLVGESSDDQSALSFEEASSGSDSPESSSDSSMVHQDSKR
jgi:hypothetical protein